MAIALTLGLGLVEGFLRMSESRVARSDRLDPGLVQHHPLLGWALAPSWHGTHRHLDFEVNYSTDEAGFRRDPHRPASPRGQRIAVVGDSFTFGLGVEDGETFVSLLNQHTSDTWWNAGVPGYSTDQECLQLERDVLPRRPQGVLVVVYLANDLLDNPRTVPLQVRAAKPRFGIVNGTLELQNTPVPDVVVVGDVPSGDLLSAVFPDGGPGRWRRGLERRSALLRRILGPFPPPESSGALARHLSDEVALFGLLLRRASAAATAGGAWMAVAVLPGRSWVESPRSLSAQYQEHLRQEVLKEAHLAGIPVVDLGEGLRLTPSAARGGLFHPREGHLTRLGHERVSIAIRGASVGWGGGRR